MLFGIKAMCLSAVTFFLLKCAKSGNRHQD